MEFSKHDSKLQGWISLSEQRVCFLSTKVSCFWAGNSPVNFSREHLRFQPPEDFLSIPRPFHFGHQQQYRLSLRALRCLLYGNSVSAIVRKIAVWSAELVEGFRNTADSRKMFNSCQFGFYKFKALWYLTSNPIYWCHALKFSLK